MHLARCLSRRTEKGKAYGDITAKAIAVLEALLWTFHNAKSGLCFPSYEKIADAASCARSKAWCPPNAGLEVSLLDQSSRG
jgi:hypothetical protein